MKYLVVASLFAGLTAPAFASINDVAPQASSAKTVKVVNQGSGMSRAILVEKTQPGVSTGIKRITYIKR